MSILDNFVLTITSCFASRRDESNVENIIQRRNNKTIESLQSDEDSQDENSIQFKLFDNSYLYNFNKIFDFLSKQGISGYLVNPFSSNQKVKPASVRYDFSTNSFIVKKTFSGKEIILQINFISEFIYGSFTSNFLLVKSTYDLIPWRCFSLFLKNLETFDFICEDDDETFYILSLLEIILNKNLNEKLNLYLKGDINIKSIIANLYWKRVIMKLNFSKIRNKNY